MARALLKMSTQGDTAQATTPTGHAPLVSIIVPTYNYAHFIPATLASLQAQTYPHWECIVVDDGSSDDTRAVVERTAAADPRVRYVYQENRRQSAARNTGLRRARGAYVQFLDADDLLEARKLERHVAYLQQHPEVDIVYSGVRYFNTGRPTERLFSMEAGNEPWMPLVSGRGTPVLRPLVAHNIMAISCPLLRRAVVAEVGFFDQELLFEDWDYFIRCAARGKVFQYEDAPDTLALVRIHPTSSSRDNARMIRMELLVRARLDALLADAELRALNRTLAVQATGQAGVYEFLDGHRGRGLARILRACAQSGSAGLRLKWLACALAAPFVPGVVLLRLATSPASESPRRALRKLKGVWSRAGLKHGG